MTHNHIIVKWIAWSDQITWSVYRLKGPFSTSHTVCCVLMPFLLQNDTHPQSHGVHDSVLCSSRYYLCLSLNAERERFIIFYYFLVDVCQDNMARLTVTVDSIAWTQWGRATLNGRCMKGRNTSPAFTFAHDRLFSETAAELCMQGQWSTVQNLSQPVAVSKVKKMNEWGKSRRMCGSSF